MAVRLVVTITAAPGKGSELAQAYTARPGLRPKLRVGSGAREDYQYNRTR